MPPGSACLNFEKILPTPISPPKMPSRRPPRLLVEERRRRIVELLETEERVTVDALVDRFSVSAVTIRGDLDRLADSGQVVRSHGGALKRVQQRDVPIAVKETLHHS